MYDILLQQGWYHGRQLKEIKKDMREEVSKEHYEKLSKALQWAAVSP